MRAFSILKTLSGGNRILLVDANVFRNNRSDGVDDELRAMCESIVRIRLSFLKNHYARLLHFLRTHLSCLLRLAVRKPVEYSCAHLVRHKELGSILKEHFDRIFVFRLYSYPIAELFQQVNPDSFMWLDFDDIESTTRSRMAELRHQNGERCESALLEIEAEFFKRLEKEVLPGCERVFVASKTDREKVMESTGEPNLFLLPNVYVPQRQPASLPENAGFTFLFIGSYGYYPNYEAAVMLCRNVIPRLVEMSRESILFRFAGRGANPHLQRMIRNTKGADYVGPVKHVDAAYAGISAVVAPINAGGGTRIKILEAFAFGKPIVSTHLGAEGIECEHGVHLLLADSPEEFANQCLRLVDSPKLCESLARSAAELLQRKYCSELLNKALEPWCA